VVKAFGAGQDRVSQSGGVFLGKGGLSTRMAEQLTVRRSKMPATPLAATARAQPMPEIRCGASAKMERGGELI